MTNRQRKVLLSVIDGNFCVYLISQDFPYRNNKPTITYDQIKKDLLALRQLNYITIDDDQTVEHDGALRVDVTNLGKIIGLPIPSGKV